LAIVADLGDGQRLWLKAEATADSLAAFEAAGCLRFTYLAKGEPKSMNYYSAPEDAMESPALMRPWATRALDAAVRAQATQPAKKRAQASKQRTPLQN
jgi:DNA transformation protein